MSTIADCSTCSPASWALMRLQRCSKCRSRNCRWGCLADDTRSGRDGLLIARGQRVTERLIERLVNLGEVGVREPLRVYGTAGNWDV
jgi:hypothetical protein